MIRHITIAAALLLSLSACSKSQQELTTIEEAESYATARGVVLTEKKENTAQRVAPRAYRYKANGPVDMTITQFASVEAAATWKKMSDEIPLGGATHVQKGPCVFSVWGATDAERQKVIASLQPAPE